MSLKDVTNLAANLIQSAPAILEALSKSESVNSQSLGAIAKIIDTYANNSPTNAQTFSKLKLGLLDDAVLKQFNKLPGANVGLPLLLPLAKPAATLLVSLIVAAGLCELSGCANPLPEVTDSTDSGSTTGDFETSGATTEVADDTSGGDPVFEDTVEACTSPAGDGVIADIDDFGGLCLPPETPPELGLPNSIVFKYHAETGVDNLTAQAFPEVMSELGPLDNQPQATASVVQGSAGEGVMPLPPEEATFTIAPLADYGSVDFGALYTADTNATAPHQLAGLVASFMVGEGGAPSSVAMLTNNALTETDMAPGTLIYGSPANFIPIHTGGYNPSGLALVGDPSGSFEDRRVYVINRGLPGTLNGDFTSLAYLGTVQEITAGMPGALNGPLDTLNLGPAATDSDGIVALKEIAFTMDETYSANRLIFGQKQNGEDAILIISPPDGAQSTIVLGTVEGITAIVARNDTAYVAVESFIYVINLETGSIDDNFIIDSDATISAMHLNQDGTSLLVGYENKLQTIPL